MRKSYDFIVVGAGVFGAWTAWYLRRNGLNVALLDAYGPANSRASSGGETRVIRMGYGANELYTKWSARSLLAWKQLAERTRQELFHKSGVLWLSSETDVYTQQTLEVLSRNCVHFTRLSAGEIAERYPQLSFSDVQCGILETESGMLMARQAVQALVREAISEGVEYHLAFVTPPREARGWNAKAKEVRTATQGLFSVGTLVFACGPWLPKLFPDLLRDRIRPTRQEVFFLGVPPGDDSFGVNKMPVWFHHVHSVRPYALPDVAARGFKIAFDRHGPEFDPDIGSRVVDANSVAELRAYLTAHVPRLKDAPIVETRVCQYENTSNGDFLVDRHPDNENVWLVGGGSGHGFKHGPAVGEYAKDLILGLAVHEPRFSLATKERMPARTIF